MNHLIDQWINNELKSNNVFVAVAGVWVWRRALFRIPSPPSVFRIRSVFLRILSFIIRLLRCAVVSPAFLSLFLFPPPSQYRKSQSNHALNSNGRCIIHPDPDPDEWRERVIAHLIGDCHLVIHPPLISTMQRRTQPFLLRFHKVIGNSDVSVPFVPFLPWLLACSKGGLITGLPTYYSVQGSLTLP
jgi:hypothetical protein